MTRKSIRALAGYIKTIAASPAGTPRHTRSLVTRQTTKPARNPPGTVVTIPMTCSSSGPSYASYYEDMIVEIPTSCVIRINAVVVSAATVAIA